MTGTVATEAAGRDPAPGPLRPRKTRVRPGLLPALLLAAGSNSVGFAQDDSETEAQYQPDEVPTCNVTSASRTRDACGIEAATVTRTERESRLTFELAAPAILQCEVVIDSEYTQRDTIVRVNGSITNETCAASSGEYEIEIRVRNSTGEQQVLVFSESWQRDDDQPVAISADYPIGENTELIRLRSRGLRCNCTDPAEE